MSLKLGESAPTGLVNPEAPRLAIGIAALGSRVPEYGQSEDHALYQLAEDGRV